MTALAKCVLLGNLADAFKADGVTEVKDMLANLQIGDSWSVDTVNRYINVGRRIASMPKLVAALELMEYNHGRMSLFDGITALRSLSGLAVSEDDAVYITTVLMLEQAAKIRKPGSFTPLRQGGVTHDIARRLKAILVRRDLLNHLSCTFPKMKAHLVKYEMPGWFLETYGLRPDGSVDFVKSGLSGADDSDGEEKVADDAEETVDVISSYACLPVLTSFLDKLCRNVMEHSMCKLAETSVPGKALNLTSKDDVLAKALDSIRERYSSDFPPVVDNLQTVAPKVVHAELEVTNENLIETEPEYRQRLAAFNESATFHETQAATQYICARVEFVIDDLSPTLDSKLDRCQLLTESKVKLFIYDTLGDGPLDWSSIKKRRLNIFGGTGPGLSKSRLECVSEVFQSRQDSESDADIRSRNVLMCICKHDVLKPAGKSATEIIKSELLKCCTPVKKYSMTIGTVEMDQSAPCLR